MKRKSLFLSARFFVFLMLTGVIAGIAIPAEAQNPSIEWIRIYLNPTLHDARQSGTAANARVDTTDTGGKFVHTDSNGEPIGATRVTSSSQIAKWNDLIAIAIRLNNVARVTAQLDRLTGWDTAATAATNTERVRAHIFLEDSSRNPVSADQSFTVIYLHRVEEGDYDIDGGWIPNTYPFGRWEVQGRSSGDKYVHNAADPADQLTAFTYSGYNSIVYPQVNGYPTIASIKFYRNPTVWIERGYDISPSSAQAQVLKGESTDGGHPTGTEVTADDPPFSVGEVIGIAVTLENVKRAVPRITLGLNRGGATNIRVRDGRNQPTAEGGTDRTPSELWGNAPLTNPANFVMYYGYRVQNRDLDLDGDWFTTDSSGAITPFTAGSIVGPADGSYATTTDLAKIKMPADLVSSIVWPKIDYDTRVVSLSMAPPPAGQSGKSRYHEVRQACLHHHNVSGDEYIAACEHVAAPGLSTVSLDAVTYEAAYFKRGDEVALTVNFNRPVKVSDDPAKQPTFYISGDGYRAELKYKEGSGTDSLVFALKVGDEVKPDYVVTEPHTFGGLQVWSNAFWRNTHTDYFRLATAERLPADEVRWIRDLADNDFNTGVALETQWDRFVTDMPELADFKNAFPHPAYAEQSIPAAVAAYKRGIIKFLVDTIPATVSIPDLRENGAQRDAFEVEFRFYNEVKEFNGKSGHIADEVGTSFTDDDVAITGTGVDRADWKVELAYVGLDHRTDTGDVVNSATALVYKATITPPFGFSGDVSVSVPAGATQDIAGNPSNASNTLRVPVDTRLSLETGQAPVTEIGAGETTVLVPFSEEGLTYEGEHPPYITIYLGDEVPANARHATWQKGEESPGSTIVPFVYTGGDIGAVVIADAGSLAIPEGTRLVSGSVTFVPGSAPVASPSEEVAPPPSDSQSVVTASGEAVPRQPAYLFIPVIEETEPKSPASSVPRSPVVFNELGNGSGDTNDWLEFRNVTGSDVSLKDWELSVVQDGMKEDTSLVVFPDVSVPANGLLLITSSDPTDDANVLAGGDDVTTSDVEHKGSPHRYLVASGLSLPDDGRFLLILRNAKEKLGLDEAFVDVAGGGGSGTDAFVRETTGDYDTHVWPLQVREAPGGNTEDALGSGKVWQRAKADIVGYHRDAWAEAAFTGIGYDRKVSQSASTAGTPGYPNGAVKTAADVPKGSITFSEIMVDSGGGTLPQWIELYNNSKTDAININRWKLEIQNVDSEDLVGRPIVTLTLGEKLIQPNQTLLIVAGDARASSGTRLPSDRVYNLFKLHEKNLRIKSARDTFLSAEGFYLKLTDRNGTKIDEAGNIEGTRQRQESPDWILAMSREEGVRSSLIRRYTKGTSQAADGLRRGNWVLAAHVKKVVDGELHWGHADDIGTPGYRAGGALPVELSSFSVTREEKGAVVLTWTTESEVDNAGFNLRRSEKRDGNFALINPALIAGAGTTGERQTYTFTDTSAKPGVEYYYQIEEVSFGGKPETLVTRLLPGPVSAAHRALVTFGEVKQAK